METLHALVAVGNGDGLLGVGLHSGKNVQKVMLDAQLKAYRNVMPIPRYRLVWCVLLWGMCGDEESKGQERARA